MDLSLTSIARTLRFSYLHGQEFDRDLKGVDCAERKFFLLLTGAGHGALSTGDGHSTNDNDTIPRHLTDLH